MKLSISTPQGDGFLHVHKAGCQDIAKQVDAEYAYEIEAADGTTIEQAMRDETAKTYPDWELGDGVGPDQWATVFRVFPCVTKGA